MATVVCDNAIGVVDMLYYGNVTAVFVHCYRADVLDRIDYIFLLDVVLFMYQPKVARPKHRRIKMESIFNYRIIGADTQTDNFSRIIKPPKKSSVL